ncbi:MAG: cytosine deaminase, partial [Intestinibacter sp.]|uniref:cytosine deaminase n=1 Tax=Intestinibacter sp. TaxID=1965304 RepID=UPI003F13CEF9
MLFKNGHIENSVEAIDIRVTDGKFEQIGANLEALPGEEVVDCTDKLILPPFVESHVHLDTCLTAGQPRWNMSGTLFEGIERWEERKEFLTKEDVKNRVNKVVRMQATNGVQHVRTHVDINDPKLTALEAILELREEVKDFINIQIVAFPQYGILSYPNGKELLEEALKMGADAAGAIPHFEFTREYSVESLNICFELAQKYNKLIDVHCDEIDDEASRGLETLATRAYETGMRDMVTASHTTAMHSYNNAYMIRLMRLLKMSGINFVANPCVNMHLGGRVDTYPKRRSLTRVKELTAEGCNVSFGNDDIFDPWNPLGNASMRDAVFMGLYAGHMLGYEEIMNSYKFVTTNAARTLHLGDGYGIKESNDASFVIMNAKNYYDALNYDEPVLASYKNGKLIAKTEPK